MTIAITGIRSIIAQEFVKLLPDEKVYKVTRAGTLPLEAHRYLFCQGVLAGTEIGKMPIERATETWTSNFGQIAARCDMIIERNENARICIITSESGFKGSYDTCYAGAKAAMNLYIETKKLKYPGQQLVGIAPTIIADAKMTTDRKDYDECMERGAQTRIGRWLTAAEVARLAYFLLYEGTEYISNTVIRVHGGNSI